MNDRIWVMAVLNYWPSSGAFVSVQTPYSPTLEIDFFHDVIICMLLKEVLWNQITYLVE